MKAYVSCVGCEQRELDTQKILDYLKKNNIELTNDLKVADYLFTITCAVDSTNEEKSLLEINRLSSQMKLNSKLIIGGCLSSISPEKIKKFKVYHTFSPRTIESLDNVLKLNHKISTIDALNKSIYDCNAKEKKENLSARERFEQAKDGYKVIIANGCLGACSYCMIREATGILTSKKSEEIINQIKKGIQNNEQTIMLMAGDTGAYGKDIGSNFAVLLKEILNINGNFKIYIHDFGINWLINDLQNYLAVFEIAKTNNKIGGVTIPIQSGSNNILDKMNRPYKREDAINALNNLKSYSFDIGTHIMVGFPGESDQDFNDTINLLKEIDFDFITCFSYSENPHAKSASLSNKVQYEIIEDRLKKIYSLFGSKVKVLK